MSAPRPALPLPDPDETIELSPAELHALTAAASATGEDGAGFKLIDCREPDEFAINSLPGAELIPLSTFPESVAQFLDDPATPVVVYCHHGMRSAHATHYLRSRGLRHSFSLRGGIDAWSTEVDPAVPRY